MGYSLELKFRIFVVQLDQKTVPKIIKQDLSTYFRDIGNLANLTDYQARRARISKPNIDTRVEIYSDFLELAKSSHSVHWSGS